MQTLFLDLASHAGLLACVTNERVAASSLIDHRIDDAALVPQVEDLLLKTGWSYPDLTHIACVVGPGGFTSLRVAVALSNALSHALKIPSAGIHLSDVYCARTPPPPSPLPHASLRSARERGSIWLHSTKKHELFIRGFGALAKEFSEPECVKVEDLQKKLTAGMQWIGELIPEHQKIIDDLGLQPALLRPVEEILPEFLGQQSYAKQILVPWYGRGW